MTHAEMYTQLYALTGRSNLDSSYHAAFYLLSTNADLFKLACKHVSSDGIGFRGMKLGARYLNEPYRQVMEIAHNLFSWTDRCPVTPYDMSLMGYPVLENVVNAIHIAAGYAAVHVEHLDGYPHLVLSWDKYEKVKALYAQIHCFESVADEADYGMEP